MVGLEKGGRKLLTLGEVVKVVGFFAFWCGVFFCWWAHFEVFSLNKTGKLQIELLTPTVVCVWGRS